MFCGMCLLSGMCRHEKGIYMNILKTVFHRLENLRNMSLSMGRSPGDRNYPDDSGFRTVPSGRFSDSEAEGTTGDVCGGASFGVDGRCGSNEMKLSD